jgi:hypothetical protein
MFKKFLSILNILILAMIVVFLMPLGSPKQKACADNAPEKLVQGTCNVVLGAPIELFKQPIIGAIEAKKANKNRVVGGFVGFFKGIGMGARRVGGGIIDMGFFWTGTENTIPTYPWQ